MEIESSLQKQINREIYPALENLNGPAQMNLYFMHWHMHRSLNFAHCIFQSMLLLSKNKITKIVQEIYSFYNKSK